MVPTENTLNVTSTCCSILTELNARSCLNIYRKAGKTTSLGALFERTAQGHHWLVAELESVSLTQAVHTLGVDSSL